MGAENRTMTASAPVLALVGMGPGMGRALAARWGRAGYRLALVARRPEALEAEAAGLRAEGFDAQAFTADAGDVNDLRGAFEGIRATMGDPETLIYNASIFREAQPSALDPAAFEAEFRAMATGFLVAAQAVIPAMRAARKGAILLTGGGSALSPFSAGASLSVGKAAQRSLLLSLAQELKDTGIACATLTICGFIQPGTAFDPDAMAEAMWNLRASGEAERVVK